MTKTNDLYQQIIITNTYNNQSNNLNKLIWDSIETADDSLIHSLNNKLTDTYRQKINLIFNILYSPCPLEITGEQSIKKFFNILSPLNNEFSMGSFKWNYKVDESKLYVQNSITKYDLNDYLKEKYLNPIQNILKISNVKFDYYEIKSR